MLSAIVCGATLAFLFHNYHPAKIFMGDSGRARARASCSPRCRVDGVLKTAATITLVAPLLVLAVPILDTSFVVLKRLKYRRAAVARGPQPLLPPVHAHRLLPAPDRGLPARVGRDCWPATRSSLRFVPPRPRGDWDLRARCSLVGVGLLVVAASVWMVYTLEILKARHLRVLGFSREEDDEDDAPRAPQEEPAAQALSGTRR